jgi:hypothetical protein
MPEDYPASSTDTTSAFFRPPRRGFVGADSGSTATGSWAGAGVG